MRVLEVRNVYRDQVPLFYRMNYVALAVMEFPLGTSEVPIHFSVEMDPLGQKTFEVFLDEPIDYPIFPVLRDLQSCIAKMDSEGVLT